MILNEAIGYLKDAHNVLNTVTPCREIDIDGAFVRTDQVLQMIQNLTQSIMLSQSFIRKGIDGIQKYMEEVNAN